MTEITCESAQHHCRTCLRNLESKWLESDTPRRWYHLRTEAHLADWVRQLAMVNVVSRATTCYPQYVCEECYVKLRNFHEFQEQVRSVAVKLEELFGRSLPNDEAKAEEQVCVKQEQELDVAAESLFVVKQEVEDETEVGLETSDNGFIEDTDKFNADPMLQDSNIPSTPSTRGEQAKAVKAYKCSQCNRSYVHKYTYIAHIRQDHLGIERAFECDQCHKKYTKFCNLYRHMRLEHDEALRQFKCEYPKCNRSFRQLKTRRQHYEEFHHAPSKEPRAEPLPDLTMEVERKAAAVFFAQEPPAISTPVRRICPLCAEQFDTLYNLQMHMQLHQDEMKYVCEICGKHKISQAKLDEHMATVHYIQNIPCPLCPKIFKHKSHVATHIQAVHKGLRPFACQYCPASFAAKNTLKLHTRTHTGEKPYGCDICDRRFSQLTPLKKHKQTHEQGRRNAIVDGPERGRIGTA